MEYMFISYVCMLVLNLYVNKYCYSPVSSMSTSSLVVTARLAYKPMGGVGGWNNKMVMTALGGVAESLGSSTIGLETLGTDNGAGPTSIAWCRWRGIYATFDLLQGGQWGNLRMVNARRNSKFM